MKKWAFILLASVIGSQLVIIAGVLVGCFLTYPNVTGRNSDDVRCSGERVGELLSVIVAQSFALYAAEK